MKKTVSLFLTVLMVLSIVSFAAADETNGVAGVSALAEVYTYHQITAFVIEYTEEVAAPEEGTYEIVDFAPAHMKEDYDQRPFAEAKITAVYTNDAPELREDKTSVPGKYVIIEQQIVNGSFYDEEAGIWKPNYLCGLATWRNLGEKAEHIREEYSELMISQQKNIVNANGDIVSKPCALPTLQKENVHTAIVDDFVLVAQPSYNGKYETHFSYYIPKNYDASKSYPVVLTCHGAGGSINYLQQDADGNLMCIGGDLGRDAVPVAWAREVEEDVIVISQQRWMNPPEEWEVNEVEDTLKNVDYVAALYNIDRNRIYGIGSSAGTSHLSKFIMTYPAYLAGYIQCNGSFNSANIYKEEYRTNGKTMITSCTWAESLSEREDCFLPEEEQAEARAKLQCVVDNKLPIYIWHGVNDATASWTSALSAYKLLQKMYREAGLSDAEIDSLVKLYFADDTEYHDHGICEIHATSKLAVWYPWVMEWLLAQ